MFGCGKEKKGTGISVVIPTLNILKKTKKNQNNMHYMVEGRIRAGIAHCDCDNSSRYEVCFRLASVKEAWHSVLHLCIMLAASRNRHKTNNGKQDNLKAAWYFLSSSPESLQSKKRKGCGPHLVTQQHTTQYGVCKLWMINTQKAVLLLTQEAEPCQGTFHKWCRNL